MKFNSATKLVVVSCTILGTVIVATSQPGKTPLVQSNGWPTHSIMPQRVSMNAVPPQMQEFKDAATLHLNDIQKAMMEGYLGKYPPVKYVVIETLWRSIINTKIYKSDPILNKTAPGGGTPGHQITPTELAILYYTFDEGIDMIGKTGAASSAKAEVTPSGIEAKISAKDMGMTDGQLRQMVMTYVDNHPMRFWNQARVGLASGR